MKSSKKKRGLRQIMFGSNPFSEMEFLNLDIMNQGGSHEATGDYKEEEGTFFHPLFGFSSEMMQQAFQYDQQNHNQDSISINWHEEKDHFELVVTCPGLSKKRTEVAVDGNDLVIKGKLKPVNEFMDSVTFHRRVELPHNAIVSEKPYITNINVERSEYDGVEGICVILKKDLSKVDEEPNSNNYFGEEEYETTTSSTTAVDEETPAKSKKSKKSKKNKKKKNDMEEFIMDAQFIEKCS